MTYRDPIPEPPDCPVCETSMQVQRHDTPHQGRFLCLACMLLFDGTSAEWAPTRIERWDISAELAEARAALRGDKEDAGGMDQG